VDARITKSDQEKSMKAKFDMAAQAVLGLMFFVFGLNGFFEFLPMPEMGESAGNFMGGLGASGYFFPVLKTVEVVAGLLLLARMFSPLALVLLAPIVVQILLFHVFLEPGGLPMAIVITLIEAYLGFGVYRDAFSRLLQPKP
jgi:putative oxidoreductase